MMVVCKDRLDRIRANMRMGVEAAAAVEADIAALLAGKTYDDLASLQRRIQEKLTSGEPVDTDYWENLLKKLLVWKAKVCILFHFKPKDCSDSHNFRQSSRVYTKSSFVTGLNNSENDNVMKLCKLKKSCLLVLPD